MNKNTRLIFGTLAVIILILLIVLLCRKKCDPGKDFVDKEDFETLVASVTKIEDFLSQSCFSHCDTVPERVLTLPDAERWLANNPGGRPKVNVWITKTVIDDILDTIKERLVNGIFIKEAKTSGGARSIYIAWPSYVDSNNVPDQVYQLNMSMSCVCPPCCDYPSFSRTQADAPTTSDSRQAALLMNESSNTRWNAPIWISRNALINLLSPGKTDGVYIREAQKEMMIKTAIVWASWEGNQRPPADALVYEILTRPNNWRIWPE